MVDGLPATRNDQRVAVGDTVTLGDKRRWIGKDLRIVYEDQYLVAVDKPEGMLSVSTAFETNDTAFSLVQAHTIRSKCTSYTASTKTPLES